MLFVYGGFSRMATSPTICVNVFCMYGYHSYECAVHMNVLFLYAYHSCECAVRWWLSLVWICCSCECGVHATQVSFPNDENIGTRFMVMTVLFIYWFLATLSSSVRHVIYVVLLSVFPCVFLYEEQNGLQVDISTQVGHYAIVNVWYPRIVYSYTSSPALILLFCLWCQMDIFL